VCPIEHPCRHDDRGAGGRKRADEDLLTAALLAVVNIDRAAVRGVPAILDLRAKCDMGRMSLELRREKRVVVLRLR